MNFFKSKHQILSLVLVAVPQLTYAGGEHCAALFNAEKVKADQVQSERFRNEILKAVRRAESSIEKSVKRQRHILSQDAARRSRASAVEIDQVIQSSAALSKMDFSESRRQNLKPEESVVPPIFDIKKPDPGHPYFIWLKANSLKSDLSTYEPHDVLSKLMDEGHTLELSVIVMQAKLDPTLSPKAREAAEKLRALSLMTKIINQEIHPLIAERFSSEATAEAWSMLPSLKEGRTNLLAVVDRMVWFHGRRFSRTDFEKLILVVQNARQFAESSRTATGLVSLRQNLSLKDEASGGLSDAKLVEVIGYLLDFKTSPVGSARFEEPSYEMTIVDVFLTEGSVLQKAIRRARSILDVAQSFSNDKEAMNYLTTESPRRRLMP